MPAPLLLILLLGTPLAARAEDLILLLEARQCPNCQLADSDLVHADLRNANLKGAQLRRANLSHVLLDGADLSGSDLSYASFQGASLRGADLRNSRLMGTDLRRADLTDALLDENALDQSHWDGAKGASRGARSHAGLHNAGVVASKQGRWPLAEQLFGAAIDANPNEPLSWVARGLSRGEQGKDDLASRDWAHAGQLFAEQGDWVKANQLEQASRRFYDSSEKTGIADGNGIGSALLNGAITTVRAIAPIALKALKPIIP